MNNYFEYKTACGLNVCYVYKPEFNKCYAGIGVRYGSSDLDFRLDRKKYRSPEGLAHFIEHKLFLMPKGDAFPEFSKLNANANAYTTCDKTIYYFTTTSDLYKPLKLLLEMYFTPYFPNSAVDSEKNIIISEIKMYEDLPEVAFSQEVLNALYPNHNWSRPVAGTVESTNCTKAEDLELAYKAFYTPNNSELVIIGNKPKEEVFEKVETILAKLKLKNTSSKSLISSEFGDVIPKLDTKKAVASNLATLAIRLDADSSHELFCNYLIGIFDCLFSPMSAFYQELYQKKAFFADIDYYVVTLENTSYAIISTTSNKPELFLNLVETKLKSLKIKDLDTKILNLYIKHLRAKAISQEDLIEDLGDEILSLKLENASYFKEVEMTQALKPADFKSYICYLINGKYVKAICKKSQNNK